MKKIALKLLFAAAFMGVTASASMIMPGDMDQHPKGHEMAKMEHSQMDERDMKDGMPFEKKQERMKMHISEMKSNMNQFEMCVNNSKSNEDLKVCKDQMKNMREAMKSKMEAMRANKQK